MVCTTANRDPLDSVHLAALQPAPERGLQLVAGGEQRGAAKDVQPQPGPRHGDHQSPHIPQMPDSPRAHEAQQHILVLLSLVLVHGGDLPNRWQSAVSVFVCNEWCQVQQYILVLQPLAPGRHSRQWGDMRDLR